jgi:hypothetical protein
MSFDLIYKQLADLTDNVRRKSAALRDGDHVDLIRHFAEVRIFHDMLDEAVKALNEQKELLSRTYVPDCMGAAGVKTINVVGVGRVTVSNRWTTTMLDKERGMQHLRDTGNGGLIQDSVPWQTLSAFSKNLMETEGKELPDDIFKSSIMKFTSITKA